LSPASTTSTEQARTAGLFPLFLRLSGARCLVVGGGAVAARKVEALLRAGAEVTVVAPEIGEELERLLLARETTGQAPVGAGSLAWQRRSFRDEDAPGHLLLVAATDDCEVNRRASAAAGRSAVLVNVVDDPEASDFFVPSVLERGALQIAVSTSGEAPALAAGLRRRLEELFPQEWSQVVELVGAARREVLAAPLTPGERRGLNAELAALDFGRLLEQGGLHAVETALARVQEGRA
jgi:siroheme synthase-like protein